MESLIPTLASTLSLAATRPYTVTHTVYLGPVDTEPTIDLDPVVFFKTVTTVLILETDNGSTIPSHTATTHNKSKVSIIVPTTLITDANVHEAPNSTPTPSVPTITDTAEVTTTRTELPKPTFVDGEESTDTDEVLTHTSYSATLVEGDADPRVGPTTIQTSYSTTHIGGETDPTDSPTLEDDPEEPGPTGTSAAPEPTIGKGLNKLSMVLLGLWGVAFVGAWL